MGVERRAVNSLATVNQSCSAIHLGKHSEGSEPEGRGQAKRLCRGHSRPNGTTNGLTPGIPDPLTLSGVSEPASTPPLDLTPSEDFAKVDPTIYDYDVPSGPPVPPSPRSCTMQAIGTPVVKNGDSDHCREGGKGVGSESPADSSETDFLDELDHIVNLLMT